MVMDMDEPLALRPEGIPLIDGAHEAAGSEMPDRGLAPIAVSAVPVHENHPRALFIGRDGSAAFLRQWEIENLQPPRPWAILRSWTFPGVIEEKLASLPVKDINFEPRQILVRSGKG